METITITKTCPICSGDATVTVPVYAYVRWQAGELAQVAFPEMPQDQREILISGIHGDCWDAMFATEDDEDY